MKQFLYVVIVLAGLAVPAFMQTPLPTAPASTGVSILDIKKQVETSDQKKNVVVTYDPKANRSTITTTRVVLGRQNLVQEGDGTQSFGTSIPSWEVFVHTAFEGQVLARSAGEFAWRFNIYNPRFPQDSELKIKEDGEEMSFKPARSGRSGVSNLAKVEAGPQLDKTQDTIQQNTGNVADSAKPIYSIFILTRADIDRIVHGTKVKISLGKQLGVNLLKELKASLDLMLNVTNVN